MRGWVAGEGEGERVGSVSEIGKWMSPSLTSWPQRVLATRASFCGKGEGWIELAEGIAGRNESKERANGIDISIQMMELTNLSGLFKEILTFFGLFQWRPHRLVVFENPSTLLSLHFTPSQLIFGIEVLRICLLFIQVLECRNLDRHFVGLIAKLASSKWIVQSVVFTKVAFEIPPDQPQEGLGPTLATQCRPHH